MSAKNTVCFVSEDADLRKALTASFKSAGLTLIALTSSKEYLDGLENQKSHGCVVIDAKSIGLELIRELSVRNTSVPIVVLVPSGAVAVAVQALKAGAFDVAEKSGSGDAVVEAAKKGIATFGKLTKLVEEKEVASTRIASLTTRELQVLDLMVQGKKNRTIAEELGISPKTLDIHRSNVMDKMEARTIADLCRAHLLNRVDAVHLSHVV